jgi:hypothetical protein
MLLAVGANCGENIVTLNNEMKPCEKLSRNSYIALKKRHEILLAVGVNYGKYIVIFLEYKKYLSSFDAVI